MEGVRVPRLLVGINVSIGSSYVWCGGGHPCNHSKFVVVSVRLCGVRLAVKASHTINVSAAVPTIEIRDPTEDTIFQNVYASG